LGAQSCSKTHPFLHVSRRDLETFYLLHLSKPASDRAIYQAIRENDSRTLLEVGMGTGQRAIRMIRLARGKPDASPIVYTGIDAFESKHESRTRAGPRPSDQVPLSLKDAYRMLRRTGASLRLLPGNPLQAFSHAANSLGKIDLVVISADVDRAAMATAWFFVPRVLHARSLVFLEERRPADSRITTRLLSSTEILRLAEARPRRQAA
jgi:hypothetical protein